jgi:hypothetical protein
MRLHRAQLGQYNGSSTVPANYPGFGPMMAGPITLISGKVIANPATTTPQGNDCLPYQCGADGSNIAALLWCSQNNQVGAFPCSSAQCDPVRQFLNCAVATPTQAPPPPSVLMAPSPTLPALTPANIVQPMPDITQAVLPTPAPGSSCSLWCDLNAAILANPYTSLAILAGVAILLWPKGGRS